MYFTATEFQQLHAVFEYLFASPYALNGSWASSTYRYAPRYARRGPLLLMGRKEFLELYVLNPPDAVVTPADGDPAPSALNFPKIEKGEAIRVTEVDGPWWDLLRPELGEMIREIRAHQAARIGTRDRKMSAADEKYQQAADVVNLFLRKPE